MSGAALSALTRDCGRKKIEKHQYFLPEVGSQPSCGHSRASEGVPPSDTAPLTHFFEGGFAPFTLLNSGDGEFKQPDKP